MCGFVLFDTQLIIEKRRMGSKDFVQHALELFIDFIGMFRRLLIILSQKVCTTLLKIFQIVFLQNVFLNNDKLYTIKLILIGFFNFDLW